MKNIEPIWVRRGRYYLVPEEWTRFLLRRYSGVCADCNDDLTRRQIYFDPLIPVDRAGRLRLRQFQPLCAACHADRMLRKSERRRRMERAPTG